MRRRHTTWSPVLKKKVLAALASAAFAATIGVAGFAVVQGGWSRVVGPVLNASLAPTAPPSDDEDDDSPPPPVSQSYDLSAHQTLSRVILLIRENYVEPDRIKPYDMFLAALDYIQKTVPEVMVDDTEAPARITVSVGSTKQSFDLGGLDQLWEVTMALRDIFPLPADAHQRPYATPRCGICRNQRHAQHSRPTFRVAEAGKFR